MNPGGDAAEQVVRLSLEGFEVAARISGNGAKNIALLLYAALKEEKKTKGKARLTSMLKSGKELKVYTITQKNLHKFSQEAKRYGVLYCVLKDRKNTDPNAAVDVIARAEDASKIQRITERFRLATVNRADVTVDVTKDKDRAKQFSDEAHNAYSKSVKETLRSEPAESAETAMLDPERDIPEMEEPEREGRRVIADPEKEKKVNPDLARTNRDHPSEPDLTQANRSVGLRERASVREKLEGYKAEIERNKTGKTKEPAKDVVSRGAKAAIDAARSVPKDRGEER